VSHKGCRFIHTVLGGSVAIIAVVFSSGGWLSHPYLEGVSRDSGLLQSTLRTGLVTIGALAIGATAAFAVASLASLVTGLSAAVLAGLELVRVVPPLVAVPIVLALVPTDGPRILAVGTMYALLASYVYATYAFAGISQQLVNQGRLVGLGRLGRLLLVTGPGAMERLWDNLRLVASTTLAIVLVAEYLCDRGLGFALRRAVQLNSGSMLLEITLLAVAISVSMDVATRRFRDPALHAFRHALSTPFIARRMIRASASGVRLGARKAGRLALSTWRRSVAVTTPMPFLEGLGVLGQWAGVVVGVVGLILVVVQLRDQTLFQSWQAITSSGGQGGDLGRMEALVQLTARKAELNGINLTAGTYRGLELASAALEKSDFSRTRIEKASFTGTNLSGAVFRSASLHAAHFGGAILNGANFNCATITDAVFEGATELKGAFFQGVSGGPLAFRNARLDGVHFDRARIAGLVIEDSIVASADFTDAELGESRFVNLRGARALFRGALLVNAEMRGIELNSADLSMVDGLRLRLVDVDMFGVDLSGADLRMATFEPRLESFQGNWNRAITSIKDANIFGLQTSQSTFRNWAIEHGAVEIEGQEAWISYRRRVSLPTSGRADDCQGE
jgi:uncharacterized protein YjbI with pentapeptide repeats/ABC-type nitrate/sulfonate/bicarbonate transport system permease component